MKTASIRLRAVVALSLVVTVMWLGAVAVTSHILSNEMDEVFDSALQETGQRILQLAVIDVLGREEEGITQQVTALDAHEEYFTYLVRDTLGRVLLASHRADPAQFPVFTETGFHQTAGFRYYQEAAVRGTITLTIAEPMTHRQSVARELVIGLAFASNAAHELRTPLAGAVAQVQRLRQQTQVSETARSAATIEGTLKRLTRLSERLMQLARAEGAQLIAASPHDLRVVLRLVVDDFTRGADAGQIEFSASDAPVLFEIDPDATAIVARNLIENALRHGDDGKVRVGLTADGWLHVENDCQTVPADLLATLSGRFARGDGVGSGSGFGLAIVRIIGDRTHAAFTLASPIPGQARGFRASI